MDVFMSSTLCQGNLCEKACLQTLGSLPLSLSFHFLFAKRLKVSQKLVSRTFSISVSLLGMSTALRIHTTF